MQLPTSTQGQDTLVVFDTRTSVRRSPVAVNGVCVAQFPLVGSDQLWLIDRMVVSSSSSVPTVATVYDGDPGPMTMLNGSNSGNGDVDDVNNPYLIDAGRQLQVVWTGAENNSTGVVRIQYRVATHQQQGS